MKDRHDWEGSSVNPTEDDMEQARGILVGLEFTTPLADFAARRIAKALAHERAEASNTNLRRLVEEAKAEAKACKRTIETLGADLAKSDAERDRLKGELAEARRFVLRVAKMGREVIQPTRLELHALDLAERWRPNCGRCLDRERCIRIGACADRDEGPGEDAVPPAEQAQPLLKCGRCGNSERTRCCHEDPKERQAQVLIMWDPEGPPPPCPSCGSFMLAKGRTECINCGKAPMDRTYRRCRCSCKDGFRCGIFGVISKVRICQLCAKTCFARAVWQASPAVRK